MCNLGNYFKNITWFKRPKSRLLPRVLHICDGSAKGVAKGQHLHECCIFENSKLGRKEEKGSVSSSSPEAQGSCVMSCLARCNNRAEVIQTE
jgi:hypothetical protein